MGVSKEFESGGKILGEAGGVIVQRRDNMRDRCPVLGRCLLCKMCGMCAKLPTLNASSAVALYLKCFSLLHCLLLNASLPSTSS